MEVAARSRHLPRWLRSAGHLPFLNFFHFLHKTNAAITSKLACRLTITAHPPPDCSILPHCYCPSTLAPLHAMVCSFSSKGKTLIPFLNFNSSNLFLGYFNTFPNLVFVVPLIFFTVYKFSILNS